MHAKAKRVQETADPMTANHGVCKGLGCCGIYMSRFAPTLASIVDACVITRTLANRSNAPMTPEGMAEAMVCDKNIYIHTNVNIEYNIHIYIYTDIYLVKSSWRSASISKKKHGFLNHLNSFTTKNASQFWSSSSKILSFLGESEQLKPLHPLPLLRSLKVQWLEVEQTI